MTDIQESPTPIRACFYCAHAIIDDNADMVCKSPQVSWTVQATLKNCRNARSLKSACGPEARFWKIASQTETAK
jgi:hypothetical protein